MTGVRGIAAGESKRVINLWIDSPEASLLCPAPGGHPPASSLVYRLPDN